MDEIRLNFDEKQTCLAGFPYGQFAEPVKQLGDPWVKKYIKISSASERLTQGIWGDLD